MDGRCGRGLLGAAFALLLAACATQTSVREPMPAPGPVITPAAPGHAPNAAPRCAAGSGHVVRVTNLGPGQDGTGAMGGGVLGGVLGTNDQAAHPATSGAGHDIYVQMDDGRKLIVAQRELGGIAVGSRVSVDATCRASLLR